MSTSIPAATFDFLRDLSAHNDRDWFNAHRVRYELALASMVDFADEVLGLLREHDLIETASGKKALARIYRDVRFSKNKNPYKHYWMGGFRRATARLRGGYYFHIEPGNTVVGGGFYSPNKEDLERIRKEFEADAGEIRAIIADPTFQRYFGELRGEELKTAPKGFDREHPDIDLIRKKSFYVLRRFPDEVVLGPDFAGEVDATFRAIRPYFDYMSEVLTTDANGVSIL